MKYYLRPGEAEQLEIERRQAKKIGAALTGGRKETEGESHELLRHLCLPKAAGQEEKEEGKRLQGQSRSHLRLYREAVRGAS